MPDGKFALCIGNDTYAGELRLTSPSKDVLAIKEKLESLGFSVHSGLNLSLGETRALADEYICYLQNYAKKNKILAVIFYYSGHGMQISDTNFIVPTDFDDVRGVQLFPIQQIIDRVSAFGAPTLVFLDACRNNFEARKSVSTKSIVITPDKALYVGHDEQPLSGLAVMRAQASTFIAFAASPGDVAYDGNGFLSPFSAALVKYIDSPDLPISNLMSRVRQEVRNSTHGLQRTWDHSSLDTPFFFNPSPFVLLTGNAFLLISFLLSLLPYSFLLASPERSWFMVAGSALLPIIVLTMMLRGMQSTYARSRGVFYRSSINDRRVSKYALFCIRKSFVSALLGSISSTLVIAAVYYNYWLDDYNYAVEKIIRGEKTDWVSPPAPIGEIIIDVASGVFLISFILIFFCVFLLHINIVGIKLYFVSQRSIYRTIQRTAVGGLVAGAICAPLAMIYFGSMERPKLVPILLLPGALLGASTIIISVVNSDIEKFSTTRLMYSGISAILSLLVGGILASFVFVFFYLSGFTNLVMILLKEYGDNYFILSAGGLLYGSFVGACLGIVLGVAIVRMESKFGDPLFASDGYA
jgi:hypothetical protein